MLYQDEGETKRVNLFAGTEVAPLTAGVTLAADQGILKKGSVIGIVTDGEKGKMVDSTATDGSQSPKYVLPEEINTTDGDVFTPCYKTGVFNRAALVFGGMDTADTHEAALRLLNIHLKGEIEEE